VTFLVDAQLPPLLARTLERGGFTALHVEDIGLREATDRAIWQHALDNDLVVVTKDFDFVDRSLKVSDSPVIIWLRFGNCGNADLVSRFLSALPQISRRLEMRDRLIQVE